MKRFITEYANYRIETIKSYDLMQPDIKCEKIKKVEHIVRMASREYLTVEETMQSIAQA